LNEDKATRYQRLRRRAQAASIVASATVLVLLIVTGGAVWLRDLAHAFSGQLLSSSTSTFLPALVVVILLSLLLNVVTFPLSVYRDWLLDRRYGVERVSLQTWLTTHVKGTLIGLVLALGAVMVLQACQAWSREWWWVAAALSLGFAQIGVTAAVPWLLPSFAQLRPLDRQALNERLDRLARKAGAGSAMPVYEWSDPTAARRAQAALVGLGRTRRVLLSDMLLEAFGEEEIEVIVAHELAHHVHRDLWKAALSRILMLIAGFGAAYVLLGWTGDDGGAAGPADPAALPLIILAVGFVSALASPLILALSRRQERQADAFSLDLTGNPGAFVNVMRRMAALNLAEERRPPQLVELFFASHPSIDERVAAARAWRPRPSPAR
jgi:STE24 endopeptidase